MEPAPFGQFLRYCRCRQDLPSLGDRLEQDPNADITTTTTTVMTISVIPSTAGDYGAPTNQAQDLGLRPKAPRAVLMARAPREATTG